MDDDENLRRTVEDLFNDFNARRSALITALTTDVEEFYQQCDPKRENLCLYGLPTGQWEVSLPAEDVPPDIPEPPLGINFARDGMLRKDWLYLIAAHSDSWLLAVAYYLGARFCFDKSDRQRLFSMVNDLPTVAEVVIEAQKERSTVTDISISKSKSSSNEKYVKMEAEDEDEGSDEEADDTTCGTCGMDYASDEFWIYCDVCKRWYHGKCVKITPAKAEDIAKYKCPPCLINKRTRS